MVTHQKYQLEPTFSSVARQYKSNPSTGMEAVLFFIMNENLSNLIRNVRKRRGLTQNDLATQTGTTQAYISNIEKGKVNPSLDMLERISEALKMPVPVFQFLALSSDDIPSEKREDFKKVQAPMLKLLNEAFDLA